MHHKRTLNVGLTDGVMWGSWGGLRHTWATSTGAAVIAGSEPGWATGQDEARLVGLLINTHKNKYMQEWDCDNRNDPVVLWSCWTFNTNYVKKTPHHSRGLRTENVPHYKQWYKIQSDLPIVIGKNGVAPALRCSSALMAASRDRHILCPWHKQTHTFKFIWPL